MNQLYIITGKTKFRKLKSSKTNSTFDIFQKYFKIRKTAFVFFATIMLSVFFTSYSKAVNITISSNTNWSAISTGSGLGGQPNASDNITIQGNVTLTVNVANALIGNISIGASGGANNTTSILSFNNGSVLTATNLNISGSGNRRGSLNMTSGGLLQVSGAVTVSNLNTFTPGTGTIEYNGAGNQTVSTTLIAVSPYNNLILSGSGVKTVSGITVNGILSMNGSATTTGTAPAYGTSATLQYAGSVAQNTNVEFPASFNGTGGVVINNANGVTLHAARAIAGAAPKLIIGSVVPNSVFSDGGFQLTTTGTLTLTSGTLNLGSGTATTLPAFTTKNYGAGTVVAFVSDASQTVTATNYPNLTFSGNGNKTTATGTLTVSENWSTSGGAAVLSTNNSNITVAGNITGSGNITSGSGTITVTGNWTNNGTYTANTGTVIYNGVSQNIAGLNYYNLTSNPSAGGTSLSGTADVSNTLTISTSTLNIGSHNLNLGTAATISLTSPSATKMIIASGAGSVRKSFTGNGSFTYPIGDNTGTAEYTPATISVTGSGYSSAYIELNVTNTKHPDNFSATHFLDRFWSVEQTGITGATITFTGTYVSADINGIEGNTSSAQLNGTFDQLTNPWIKFSILNSNTLTTTNAGLTDSQNSDFTGITNAAPSISISGGNVTVCPNVPVNLSTNSTGDATLAYLWTPATGLSSPTVADPTVTTSNTTLYTVTLYDGNGITATDNTTITIDPGPTANQPGGITGNIITCDGATSVQYSVQPVPNAISYNWTLPAGASIASGAGTRIITVDFPNPFTTGSICVVSENSCIIPSVSRCLSVRNVNLFTPGRILGSTNVCLNATGLVYSTDNVNGATSYNWTLPTGMTITAGTGTRTITVDAGAVVTPGPLCVSVTNACGTSNSKCINIIVNSTSQPGGITGPAGICSNTNGVVYSVQPVSGATSYSWTLPSGFTIVGGLNTRTITVDIGASPVAGDVCVAANFTCGLGATRCKTVSVNGATVGTLTGPSNVCAGVNGIAYSTTVSIGAISYNWSFPPGITQASGGSTNSITVNVDNTYTQGDICVSVTSVCGTSVQKCITVRDFSSVTPGGITGPNLVCQGATGLIYSIQPVPNAISYNWFVPPGITITGGLNTRTITVDIDNNFTTGDIGVQAVSSCPAQSLIRWNSTTTTLNPGLPATISSSAPVCPSTTVNFSVPAVAGASNYEWVLPLGMTFTAGPPTNTNSVSVDIGAGFTQGEVCVRAESSCGGDGYMRCQVFNIVPATPATISGPSGVCPGAIGIAYSVAPIASAVSYNWELPTGWSITSGSGTNSITANVAAGFIQGQVRVNAVSACGVNGIVRLLNVNYIPATPGVMSGPTSICNGNTYIYSVPAVAGADSYTWTLPTGLSFTAGPPSNTNSISVDVDGTFAGGQICVAASSACGGPGTQRCLNVDITPPVVGAITGAAAVCQGATGVAYSITPLPGISNYNWTPPANVTIISGQGTNSITVDIGGGFVSGQLCVEAENACGDPGASGCLNLALAPDAATSITPQTNFCPGSTRTLTVSPVSGASSYDWSLPAGLTLISGQGTSAITVAIDVAFASGNVCVTAYTSCNAPGTQYCENITPNAAATPTSITASSIACEGSDITFSLPVISGAGSFTWSVPSGLTIVSGQGTPTLIANTDIGFTSGNICVTANSGCGISGSQYCQNVSVTPAILGNISAPVNVCANDAEVIFSVLPITGISSYLWTIPGDMSIVSGQGSNVLTVSTSAGFVNGQVTVAAVSACGVQGAIKTVDVGNSLGTTGAISGPSYVCPNAVGIVFSVPQVTGAVSYNWTLPADMTITSGQNSNAITIATGAIFSGGQITVSAVSACSVNGPIRFLNVGFTIGTTGAISAPVAVCPNTSGVIISVPPLANAASYNWYLPADLSITAGNNTNSITVSAGPAFVGGQICVEAVSTCGIAGAQRCTTLNYLPGQPGGITGITKGVCGLTQQYSVQPAPAAASYTWTAPSGATIISGQGTRIIQVSFTGAFISGQLQVYSSNACGNSAVRTSATITGAPDKPILISGSNSVCANDLNVAYSVAAVLNATTYNWTVPSGATVASGQGTTSITVNWGSTAGNVSVTTTNTCGTSNATNLAVAINCRISSTYSADMNLSVYPNPTTEDFIVRFDAVNEGKLKFDLEDLSGRVVVSKTEFVSAGNNSIVFDVRSLPRGAYILNINATDKNLGYAKIILQ